MPAPLPNRGEDTLRMMRVTRRIIARTLQLYPTGDQALKAELAGDYARLVKLVAG
jgi:hypothetical protein